jgi:hypothetical protein
VLDRYQRRTVRLTGQAGEVTRRLAGRAGSALATALGIPLSRHTALRVLLRLPLPAVAVPRVLGIDDFALRRGHGYATIMIDAQTGQRVDVLAGRTADVVEAWLRAHPGVQVVCRDGSGAYGEAVRRALPGAIQSGDRWHLWHGPGEAVLKEIAAHSSCWAAAGPPLKEGRHAQTTTERWRQVHDLLGKGTGLLECSRRLGLSPGPQPRPQPRTPRLQGHNPGHQPRHRRTPGHSRLSRPSPLPRAWRRWRAPEARARRGQRRGGGARSATLP